jgi:hypothetical protein
MLSLIPDTNKYKELYRCLHIGIRFPFLSLLHGLSQSLVVDGSSVRGGSSSYALLAHLYLI